MQQELMIRPILSKSLPVSVTDFDLSHLNYVNKRILEEMPTEYRVGTPYATLVRLVRFVRTGWETVNITDPEAPLVSTPLHEVLVTINLMNEDDHSWRPVLPRELLALSRIYPHIQKQLQVLGLGYLNFAHNEQRHRALVLGGGDVGLFGDVQSLFYNLANYHIGPGTCVAIAPEGNCPEETELLRPYRRLLAACRSMQRHQ